MDVLEEMKQALSGAGASERFRKVLEGRIRQLGANMVDGRVLSHEDADALRVAMVEFISAIAVQHFVRRDPNGGLGVLAMMKAYGWPELPAAAESLHAALSAKHPAPPPGEWKELAAIRSWAETNPAAASFHPGVQHIAFIDDLKRDERVRLPSDVVSLYAATAEFSLACAVELTTPAFSLIPPSSLDILDSSGRTPKRAAAFGGMDGETISVCMDSKRRPWMFFDHDGDCVAKRELDIPSLLQFGLARAMCSDTDVLIDGELSWDAFFDQE